MWKKTLITSAIVLGICLFGVRNYLQQVELQLVNSNQPYLDVKPGTSLNSLCQTFVQQQWFSSQQCWQLKLLSLAKPELRQIKAGVYAVKPMRLRELLALLRSGRVAQFSVRIQEGKTLQQTLTALEQSPFLIDDIQSMQDAIALVQWPADWGPKPVNEEGLFFPETYNYTAHEKLSAVLKRAHRELLKRLDAAWQQKQQDLPLKSRYELLILASIVEKESGYLPEKPEISAVFINRLNKNMRLQTDPTVIYGLGDRYQGDITRAFLQDPHPYNTYIHNGLPPGPIASVSQTSLDAAAKPVVSDKFYFVAKGDGSHVFSATLQEHNQNVRTYILGKKP